MSASAFSKLSNLSLAVLSGRAGWHAPLGSSYCLALALTVSCMAGGIAPCQAADDESKDKPAQAEKTEKTDKTDKTEKAEKSAKSSSADSKEAKAQERKLKIVKELCTVLAPGKAAQATMLASFEEQVKRLSDMTDSVLSKNAPEGISPEKLEAIKKQSLERALKVLRRTQQLFNEQIDINKLCDDIYTEIYDKYFSEDELKKLLAFYKSPIGKRMVEMQPKIATEAMQLTQNEIGAKMRNITQQVMQETLDQIKSDATRLPGASRPAEKPEIPAEILNTPIAPIMH